MRLNFRKIILIILTLFFTLSITSVISSQNCKNATIEPKDRILYCNISMAVGEIFIGEGAKRSIILFERFIINANLNNLEEARSDAISALMIAMPGQKLDSIDFDAMRTGDGDNDFRARYRWVLPLVKRMKEEPEQAASTEIWNSITNNPPWN